VAVFAMEIFAAEGKKLEVALLNPFCVPKKLHITFNHR
jgi:hypothetical protein